MRVCRTKTSIIMSTELKVPVMADCLAAGKQPEILFWVGSAGSFDDRAKKISRAFVKILNKANVDFAVLGTEESCTGDIAKRAGNEFLFQMQAVTNIEILNAYEVKRIVTCDPHSFNTLKNEYPGLGGKYEVVDPCYLGRANNEYDAPRKVLESTNAKIIEMKRSKHNALCCGAGGAQMFKEPEKGDMDINIMRTEDALETKPDIIAAACPYCNTMLTDGVKNKEKEGEIQVLDIAELIANS